MKHFLKKLLRSADAPTLIVDSSVDSTAHISKSASVRSSSVGKESHVSENCKISNSVLGANVQLGRRACLEHSKVDDFTSCQEHVAMYSSHLMRHSYVARNAALVKTSIGKFSSIGPNLVCGYGDHPTGWISTSPVFYSSKNQTGGAFTDKDCFDEDSPVKIGNDVWIGANVVIKNGVTIHDGAIIGAGSFVNKDIPPFAIAVGSPAKVLKHRFDETTIGLLLNTAWWNLPDEKLRNGAAHFRSSDVKTFLAWIESIRSA